ncbi:hypothetical protein ACYSNR_15035 [Enterococcus sp. LJL128]
MNWFEQYKKDYCIKSNYEISKKAHITASSLQRLDNSNDFNNVKYGTIKKLATIAELTLNEFDEYLKNQKVGTFKMKKEQIIELINDGKELYATSYETEKEVAEHSIDVEAKQVSYIAQYDDIDFTYHDLEFLDGDMIYIIDRTK